MKKLNNQNKENITIILMGKSATGKDYALQKLIEMFRFKPIISHSTRKRRENEVDGKEYYFISNEEFEKLQKENEFVEEVSYNVLFENIPSIIHYGISRKEFQKKGIKICIVDFAGYMTLMNALGKNNMLSIYIHTDSKIRTERAKKRGSFDEYEWERRLKDDETKFCGERLENFVDYWVDNDNSDGVEQIIEILKQEEIIKENT